MKKINFVLGAAVAALAIFAGCTREMITTMSSLTLETENYTGEHKAYISNNTACWENNDQIKLSRYVGGTGTPLHYNGSISITHPSGSNRADVVAADFTTAGGDVIFACYPQAKFSSGVTDSTSISVTLPPQYEYVLTNGKQKIEAPMIGKLTIQDFGEGQTNPNIMKLKNICSLLKITLNAPDPGQGAFTVDKIAVTSSSVTLNGPATIDFSGSNPALTMNDAYNHGAENDCVVLNFGTNAVAVNGTKEFFIPVPPLPNGETLKIWIHNAISNNWFTKNVSTTAAIPGNTIAVISGPSTNDPDASYTFKDYLVNNNSSSKIDLGVTPNNNMKMEITFSVPDGYMSGSQYYTGSRPGDANTQIYFGLSASGGDNKFRAHFCSYPQGNGTGANYVMSNSITRQAGVKYRQTIEVKESTTNPGSYYATVTFERLAGAGVTYAIETYDTGEKVGGIPVDATSICVFSLGQVYQPKMKLYSYRIWEGSTLLHNFVPAIDNSSNHGVYDMVTKGFRYSGHGATGSFTAAND